MEGQHMVLKQRIYFVWCKFELNGFTILGKDVSGLLCWDLFLYAFFSSLLSLFAIFSSSIRFAISQR